MTDKTLSDVLEQLRQTLRIQLAGTPDFIHGDSNGVMPTPMELPMTEATTVLMQLVPPQFVYADIATVKGSERTINHHVTRNVIEIAEDGTVTRKTEEQDFEENASSMALKYYGTQEVADFMEQASDTIMDMINEIGKDIGGYNLDTSHIELDNEYEKEMLALADRLERELGDE